MEYEAGKLTEPVRKSATDDKHFLEQTRNATSDLRRRGLRYED